MKFHFPSILCALLIFAPSRTGAEPREYEGKRIAAIQFHPERQPVESSELARLVPLKPDTPLRLSDVRSAIKRLFATGRYANIEVETEMEPAGAVVRFITTNKWFVGRIEVEGDVKEPPNRAQLVNATRLELGRPFTDSQLLDAVDGMQQLLKSNGLYEAKVDPMLDYEPATQQVHLRFRVTSGPRARFRRPLVAGDLRMPQEKIVSATKWKGWFRWRNATQANAQRGVEGVRNKYRGEDRLMASASLDSMDYDRASEQVTPSLKIDAGPKVELHVIGAKLSGKRLRRYVPIYAERTVDRDLLVEGARNLRDYFQSKGYFDVDVEFDQHVIGKDHQDIDYIIELGERHKLVKVEIQGNGYFDTDTIRERMFLQPSSFPQFRHGRYSQGFLRRDQEAIKALYRSNGFRDVNVTAEVVADYQGKQGEIAVILKIEEGTQWFVSKLEVEGVQRFDMERVLSTLSSIEGQPFSEVSVATDRDQILSLYHAGGFPEASFDWRFKTDHETQEVEVRYVISEGTERFVRDVVLSGMQATRPRLVQPNILLRSGEPLSLTSMTNTQRRLYDLGVFAKVDMAIQNPEGETQSKYVLYQMEEGHKYALTGGLGAEFARIGGSQTSLDAPAGTTGFSPRVSFDITRLNFLGLGHSLGFKSRVSTLQRRGVLNYTAPRYRNVEGRDLSFTALYDDARDVRTFTAKRVEGAVQLSQKLSKPTTALYRFTYRRVSVDEGTLKINPLLIPLLSQPVRIGMVSGNLIQDRRDDSADPRTGIYNTLDLGLASRFFASRKDFLRFLGRNATYHPIGKHWVLARSLQLGIIKPFRLAGRESDPSQAIPLPERFFGGGGTSHRAFPDNQAGPRDLLTGFPVGGKALFFHNTELRFPLLGDNINGVLFHDAGNVYSSLTQVSFRMSQRDLSDFDYMVHAVGFGVRYRTPIGPLRGDLAYGINSPRFFGFKGTREELLFGRGVQTEQRVRRFQFFFSIGQTF